MGSITQKSDETLEGRVSQIRARLKKEKFFSKKALRVLEEMQSFPLGRHLLQHGSLNGQWTKYCVADQVLHPAAKESLTPLENFILNETMGVTQERFKSFRRVIQAHLKNGMTIASVPCGLSDDLKRVQITSTMPDVSGAAGLTWIREPSAAAFTMLRNMA